MSLKEQMLERLKEVERLANTSKAGRLLHHPFRYISSILFKNFIYPRNRKDRIRKARIFTGREMNIILPSSTDIYLTGGKSHISEIRLARFLIHNLNEGDHFLDIGAHYGYFSLIASDLIGNPGKLIALEPSSMSVSVLEKNCRLCNNTTVIPKAISDKTGDIIFYEFPNLFSEYNSVNQDQFKDEKWFKEFKPVKTTIQATTINELTKETFLPKLIKIDVEGAELKVIQGGLTFFENENPVIAMEYLSPQRGNTEHRKAVMLLKSLGYSAFSINNEGALRSLDDIEEYLSKNHWESDNIILKK